MDVHPSRPEALPSSSPVLTGSWLMLGGLVLACTQTGAVHPELAWWATALQIVLMVTLWWLSRRHTHQWRALQPSQPPASEDICQAVLPVWSRQIQAARTQLDHAVDALVTRFASMSTRLSQSSHAGQGASSHSLLVTLDAAQHQLTELLHDLEGALTMRQELFTEVVKVSQFAGQLQ
ncbi:MAG TPA: hypothetical protein VFM48_15990, partial [Aquabacterium sp.]|nr:hypothetical protein [Aquabacterium sp.]